MLSNIGIGELLLLLIISIIILGPNKLPEAIKQIFKIIRRMRNISDEINYYFLNENSKNNKNKTNSSKITYKIVEKVLSKDIYNSIKKDLNIKDNNKKNE